MAADRKQLILPPFIAADGRFDGPTRANPAARASQWETSSYWLCLSIRFSQRQSLTNT